MDHPSDLVVVDNDDHPFAARCPAPFKAANNAFVSAWHYVVYMKALHLKMYGSADRLKAVRDVQALEALDASMPQAADKALLTRLSWDLDMANWMKFQADPGMRDALLATGARPIVSVAHPDTVWSAQLPADGHGVADRSAWFGRNLEGTSLMKTRDMIRAAIDPVPLQALFTEPVSLQHKIEVSCFFSGEEPVWCPPETRRAWLADIRHLPREQLVHALREYMRRRYWDTNIYDDSRDAFIFWARTELGVDPA